MRHAGAAVLVAICGCMPPSVKAVDDWLIAYAAGDVDGTVAKSASQDRELVKAALLEQASDANGPAAMLLPPKPIRHEILEIAEKESDDRHVVLAKVTAKNPLPFASERVGQVLADIPKSRSFERKFLALREGETWVVKLDLPAVKARAEFASAFFEALAKKDFEVARSMLTHVPPPPDDPNALATKDRMSEELQQELKKASTSTVTH
jgi:hypothetical protein